MRCPGFPWNDGSVLKGCLYNNMSYANQEFISQAIVVISHVVATPFIALNAEKP